MKPDAERGLRASGCKDCLAPPQQAPIIITAGLAVDQALPHLATIPLPERRHDVAAGSSGPNRGGVLAGDARRGPSQADRSATCDFKGSIVIIRLRLQQSPHPQWASCKNSLVGQARRPPKRRTQTTPLISLAGRTPLPRRPCMHAAVCVRGGGWEPAGTRPVSNIMAGPGNHVRQQVMRAAAAVAKSQPAQHRMVQVDLATQAGTHRGGGTDGLTVVKPEQCAASRSALWTSLLSCIADFRIVGWPLPLPTHACCTRLPRDLNAYCPRSPHHCAALRRRPSLAATVHAQPHTS